MSDQNIRPNVRPNIRPNVRLKCPTQMFDQMFDQMSDQIFDPMSDQMSDQMFDQTFNQIFDQMFVRNFRPKLLPTHVLQNIVKMQQKCCLRRRPNILRMEQRVIFNMFGGVKNSISADYLVRPKSWRRGGNHGAKSLGKPTGSKEGVSGGAGARGLLGAPGGVTRCHGGSRWSHVGAKKVHRKITLYVSVYRYLYIRTDGEHRRAWFSITVFILFIFTFCFLRVFGLGTI